MGRSFRSTGYAKNNRPISTAQTSSVELHRMISPVIFQ
jgi:hypothetical protein